MVTINTTWIQENKDDLADSSVSLVSRINVRFNQRFLRGEI